VLRARLLDDGQVSTASHVKDGCSDGKAGSLLPFAKRQAIQKGGAVHVPPFPLAPQLVALQLHRSIQHLSIGTK